MSNVGNITTRRHWPDLVAELVDEFRKWGIPRHDLEIPRLGDATRERIVKIQFLNDGEWYPVECEEGWRVHGIHAALLAIIQSVKATRLADQRGIGSVLGQVVQAVAALPPARDVADPHEVLGITPSVSMMDKVSAYRKKLITAHPDRGGTAESFKAVQDAGTKLGIT